MACSWRIPCRQSLAGLLAPQQLARAGGLTTFAPSAPGNARTDYDRVRPWKCR